MAARNSRGERMRTARPSRVARAGWAAAEVGAEVVLHPARHAIAEGIGRGGVGEEGRGRSRRALGYRRLRQQRVRRTGAGVQAMHRLAVHE